MTIAEIQRKGAEAALRQVLATGQDAYLDGNVVRVRAAAKAEPVALPLAVQNDVTPFYTQDPSLTQPTAIAPPSLAPSAPVPVVSTPAPDADKTYGEKNDSSGEGRLAEEDGCSHGGKTRIGWDDIGRTKKRIARSKKTRRKKRKVRK